MEWNCCTDLDDMFNSSLHFDLIKVEADSMVSYESAE
jgi:hypothetical protein